MKSEWYPIETAPKDGRSVLLFLPRSKLNKIVCAHYRQEWQPADYKYKIPSAWIVNRGPEIKSKITHWTFAPDKPE